MVWGSQTWTFEFFQFISNFGIIQSNTSNSPMSLNVFALEEKHLLKGKTKEKTTFSDVQYISTVTSNRYCLGLLDGFVILSHTGEVLVREKTKQGVSVIETMENCDTVAIVGNGKEFWEFKDPNFKDKEPVEKLEKKETDDDTSFTSEDFKDEDIKEMSLYRDKILIWNFKEKKRVRLISISNPILGLRIHKE
jgi:hypothetical protein